MFIIDPTQSLTPNARERNFMMIMKDMQEMVKIGENSNKITQLELRYALWRRNKGLQAND